MWGGEEATDSEIQKVWDDHLNSFAENNLPIPGWIWKEVEDFYSRPANQRHQQLNLEPEIDPSLLEPTEFAEEFNLNPDDDDEMDPDEVTIQWTRNHEWSVLHHTYADSTYLDAVSEKYKNLVDHFVAAPEAAVDEGKELNGLQRLGCEMIVHLVEAQDADAGDKLGVLIGRGGTGKSTTINAAEKSSKPSMALVPSSCLPPPGCRLPSSAARRSTVANTDSDCPWEEKSLHRSRAGGSK